MGTSFRWLPSQHEKRAEMWPLDGSTIQFNWEQGLDTPGAPLSGVFWDSSPDGAACISIRRTPGEVWKIAGMRYNGATSIATVELSEQHLMHRFIGPGNRQGSR